MVVLQVKSTWAMVTPVIIVTRATNATTVTHFLPQRNIHAIQDESFGGKV
jgi:hypothetical protein